MIKSGLTHRKKTKRVLLKLELFLILYTRKKKNPFIMYIIIEDLQWCGIE